MTDKKIGPKRARPRWIGAARARAIDDAVTARLASVTRGLAPVRIAEAYLDWALNLATSPGRQLQLAESLLRTQADLLKALVGRGEALDDPMYSGDGWRHGPLAWLARLASHTDRLLDEATAPLPGMERHNAEVVRFYTRLLADTLSPANLPLTNPDVLAALKASRGRSLGRGIRNAGRDLLRSVAGKGAPPSERFRVGETVACTPGKVIYRNALIELIQYSPATPDVYAEPVLIVPAWIMKYYILDLSPGNSMIRWLVAQGHTVFAISWKNPGPDDRGLSMDDYRRLGVLAALDAVTAVVPDRKVHAVGYCVGGTLLSITSSAMARDGDERLKTVTLFAAQTDFEDAGELKFFIDDMSLHWLDLAMARRGVLESRQMAAAFALLRPRELIWSSIIRRYYLGESSDGFDIMAWNADGTRMPRRMHSDYLRQLYLRNELAQGKYRIGGRSVSVGDLKVPLFVVATVTDHVAPWKSVYKIRNLKRLGETRFVLTTGGHNAGIVSEPGRARRHFRIGGWDESATFQTADEWAETAERCDGSWWPAWHQWLAERSTLPRIRPPTTGNKGEGYGVLEDAPGRYVFER